MINISHGIVGAAGDMGTSLRGLLFGTGGQVVCVDKDWKTSNDWTKLWECDVIWLAVPRKATDKLLKTKFERLRPSQLVIDICSLKRGLAKLVGRTGAEHLSLHPMHGPNIRRDRQKWFHIGRRDRASDSANRILTYLESFGITFLDADSEDDHDFKMGVILGLKEIMTLVMDRLVLAYARDCGKNQPSIDALLEWSSPVANAFYGAYVHSVLRSEDWLRDELVKGSPGNLPASASGALAELATEVTELNLRREFKNQRSRLKALKPVRQLDISAHINAWFEDSSVSITPDRKSNAGQPRSQHLGALPICTKNLTLRPFNENDRPDLVKILRDRKVMKWVFTGPLTEGDALEFIDKHFVNASPDAPGLGVLCHAANRNFLGFAGIIPCNSPLDPKLEFGVVLTTAAQRKGGYGSEIGRKLIEIGLGPLRIKRLYALCHPENTKSIGWLKSMEMKPTNWVISNYQGNEPRKVFVIER